MSSFEEIKGLLTNEIKNSHQYLVASKIKNLIIEDILAPNVNFSFSYMFEDNDFVDINNKQYEINVIMFALKIILGFDVERIDTGIDYGVIIIMNKFLD